MNPISADFTELCTLQVANPSIAHWTLKGIVSGRYSFIPILEVLVIDVLVVLARTPQIAFPPLNQSHLLTSLIHEISGFCGRYS